LWALFFFARETPCLYLKINGMATEIEHLKYQLISWIVALNDAELLREQSQMRQQVAQVEESSNLKVRQFGGGKGMFPFIADDFNEPLEEFKIYAP
jgi:Protein of unknown function (DUF2281)